jgi:hypothetical protein
VLAGRLARSKSRGVLFNLLPISTP